MARGRDRGLIPHGGGTAVKVRDEGTLLATLDPAEFDFAGAGVGVAVSGGKYVVTIPGGLSSAYATVKDEGVARTQRAAIDFKGAGVSVADAGGDTVVTIPGGGLLGTANDILEMTWQNAGSPSQVIQHNTITAITFDTEVSDPGSWHAGAAAAFTPTVSGLYQFTAGGWWQVGGTATERWLWLRDDTDAAAVFATVSGHIANNGPALVNNATANMWQQNLTGLVRIIAGHTYRLMSHQASGVGQIFMSGALKMVRVAA